jgi:hypothetical protein
MTSKTLIFLPKNINFFYFFISAENKKEGIIIKMKNTLNI